jgi:integrase
MKPNETTPHKRKFIRVLDGRKQPVRGLWRRGEIYYAQIVDGGRQRKVRLVASTAPQAIAELNELKVKRKQRKLKIVTRAPRLVDAFAEFFASPEFSKKADSSQRSDRRHSIAWLERLGDWRVDAITTADILKVRDDLLSGDKGVGTNEQALSARSANLYVSTLLQVLKRLEKRHQLGEVPRIYRLQEEEPAERALMTEEQFGRLIQACHDPSTPLRNGAMLADYLQFLALTGCRETEAYFIRWQDVDMQTKVLTIGGEKKPKSGKTRYLNMTPELVEHLKNMEQRRQPDSRYLFPSPQRGKVDRPVVDFKGTFGLVRKRTGIRHIAFHHFRHFFISKCVMAGLDYMTIAQWVGHQDGGILIGKVYGHLNDKHKIAMAERLNFFKQPANVVPLPEQAAG